MDPAPNYRIVVGKRPVSNIGFGLKMFPLERGLRCVAFLFNTKTAVFRILPIHILTK